MKEIESVPVFYREEMSVDSHGESPSASKPQRVVFDWQQFGLPIEIKSFQAATAADLCEVHCSTYVKRVLAGQLANGHGNRNKGVSRSCLLTVGSFTAAAEEAASNGCVACSPTSGFHHAGYQVGGGYCTFNGLMAAAGKFVRRGWRVAIIDCDAHFGDGTQDIIDRKQLGYWINHWTYGRDFSMSFDWERFERKIRSYFESFVHESEFGRRIVFYQAGADVSVDDPLGPGSSGMYDSEMRQRDRFVFELCRNHQIPVVWNLAGGYQRDEFGEIPRVVERHRATMEECVRCFVGRVD